MKSSHLKWIALGYSWTARLTRYARIASVVSAVASAAAHPAASAEQTMGGATRIDRSERVYQYDLSGPRVGGTFAPDGTAMTQFGWHFESQASPGPRGPWFIVERVFLVGGVEQNTFVPNGTLVFGVRLPSSFEFGLGPSVTLRAYRGFQSGIVAAAGHSFRVGGIRVPVNVACAWQRGGEPRWTLITGWAIRDLVGKPAAAPRESSAQRGTIGPGTPRTTSCRSRGAASA